MRFRLTTAAIALFALSGCAVTPTPTTMDERTQRVEADSQAMYENQAPVAAPLTLYEAMARAIKYNLGQRATLMDKAIAEGIASDAGMDLLPQLTYSAGYSARDNSDASFGVSPVTNELNQESTSYHDSFHRTADLTMSWNILDFGVSYLRARQASDQVLVAEERRRKALQVLVQDVRSAWWRAVDSERLIAELDPLILRLHAALDASRASERPPVTPIETLDYQRELLETLRRLQVLRLGVAHAKVELAALINLPPDQAFQLAMPADDSAMRIPKTEESLAALEHKALLDRPELREEDYKARISTDETRKSMLRMLPGIEFDADVNYDSDRQLWNTSWAGIGTKLTWNLMNLVTGRSAIELSESKENLGRLRRLALNMSVLAQVNVAWTRVRLAQEQYKVTSELSDVDERIVAHSRAGAHTERDLLHREANRMLSRTRRDASFAELQTAAASLNLSTGSDPLPEALNTDDLPGLIQALRQQAGEAPVVLLAATDAPAEDAPAAEAAAKAEALPAADAAAAPLSILPALPATTAAVVHAPAPPQAHMQVGAFPTQAEAWKHWKSLTHVSHELATMKPDVRKAVVPPKGTFYRLVVAGQAEALKPVCARLKSKSVDCFIQNSP